MIRRIILLIAIFIMSATVAQAKTEKFGTWIELEFRKDFLKRFAFSVTPKIRLQDQFKPDEYLVQAKLRYEPFSFLKFAGAYRISTEVKDKGNENYYRYAFDTHLGHEFGRFEATLRGRFTNYSDMSEKEQDNYFRPRLKTEYNIKGIKTEPFISYELFQNMTKKEMRKSRLDAGFTWKLGGPHRISIYYRLHDYFTDKASIHILGIDYRMKF
jgi:hypothetical protein